MEHKWSVKEMHRLILTSQTWQQSSDNNPRHAQIDPFNRLLWRQNLRRLEFEPFRDSLLAMGGKLDTNLYGKPVPLAMAKGRNFRAAVVLEPSHRPQDIGYTTRRTIYGYIDRDRKSTRLNSSHLGISYAVFCLKKKTANTGRRYRCSH